MGTKKPALHINVQHPNFNYVADYELHLSHEGGLDVVVPLKRKELKLLVAESRAALKGENL